MRRLLAAALTGALALTIAGPASAQSTPADGTATVVHAVPGLTVDVFVNGGRFLTNFKPGTVAGPVSLPGDTQYDVAIFADGAIDDSVQQQPPGVLPAIAGSAFLPAGADVSLVAGLLGDGTPNLFVFVNDVSPTDPSKSRVAVRHVAAAGTVDGWINLARIRNIDNGEDAVAQVRSGWKLIWASAPGRLKPIIGPVVAKLASGDLYQVYAWGTANSGFRFLIVPRDL